MSAGLTTLFEQPHALTFLALGFLMGMAVEHLLAKRSRRVWSARRKDTTFRFGAPHLSWPKRDAVDQLRIVMSADFTVQPLLNKAEKRVFRALDQLVAERNPGWRVMAQVSLGEVLRTTDASAFSCINSKRVDTLLVDEHCHPRHAIEYQGAGHHQKDAAARDAVKKEALRRAGIGYHEVIAGQTTPTHLRGMVERLVSKPQEEHAGLTMKAARSDAGADATQTSNSVHNVSLGATRERKHI